MSKRMTATETVRKVMEGAGYTNATLGKAIGIANTAIWDRLKKDNMRVDTLVQMLSPMGYKLVAIPSDQRMKAGWYELK